MRRAGDDVSPHSGDGAVRFGARLPCAERGTCVARQLAAASCVVARVVRGMTPRASLVRFLCTLAAYAAGVTAVRASDAVAVPVCRIAKKSRRPVHAAPRPRRFFVVRCLFSPSRVRSRRAQAGCGIGTVSVMRCRRVLSGAGRGEMLPQAQRQAVPVDGFHWAGSCSVSPRSACLGEMATPAFGGDALHPGVRRHPQQCDGGLCGGVAEPARRGRRDEAVYGARRGFATFERCRW